MQRDVTFRKVEDEPFNSSKETSQPSVNSNSGKNEYKLLGISTMKTVFHDKLIITLNIKDIRPFENIL